MDNNIQNIQIVKLTPDDWKKYRDLQLEALKEEPAAFLSSYEESINFPEKKWRKQIVNMFFAKTDDKLVGMTAVLRGPEQKSNHIARIVSVYVSKTYRGQGIGRTLIEQILA